MNVGTRVLTRALVGVCAGGMLVIPVTPSIGDNGVTIRLNDACGQATECQSATTYICSTYHNDYKDYRCSKGCDTE